jgi:hypothetical protein
MADSAVGIEAFVCRPLSISLTRSSCAARHRTVQVKGSTGGPKLLSTVCVDCPVGAAHLASQRPSTWPDGAPIELRTLTAVGDPASMPAAPARPRRGWQPPTKLSQTKTEKEKTTMPMRGTTHTWKGETKTIKEWAAEVGITDSGVRLRLKKGLNPDGSPREESAAEAKPKRKGGKPRRAPERIEVKELARVDVPSLLKALGLEVRAMDGELHGWQIIAWRAAGA